MKASKVKGELPDIIHEYIAYDSMIMHHFTFTKNIEDAYHFYDLEEAKEIAYLWSMQVGRKGLVQV